MTLSFYIARRFFRGFLLISGVFALILFLIEMIEMIRRFSDEGVGLTGAAMLAGLNIAGSFYAILPLIAVLAGIALFLGLARTSEMVAIRASGRSAVKTLIAPVVTAVVIGALAVAFLNPFVAATGKQFDATAASFERAAGQTVSLGDSAVWLRQGLAGDEGTSGQLMIRAARTSPDATTLYDATFIIFAPDAGPIRRIEAEQAVLQPGEWHLSEVTEYPLTAPNPQAAARHSDVLNLPSDLTAQGIRDGFGRPDSVPIWQLPAFIAGLERAGFSATRHRTWFQIELALPFLMASMVVVAAGFTMRHVRGRNTGVAVLLAFGAGIGVFFLRNLAQVLGDNGQVAPWIAAWAPPAVAALLGLALILQREDG